MEDNRIIILIVEFTITLILAISLLSADVISINSGGNEEIVINPDTYIEGFFSKINVTCLPTTCSNLGYNCGRWANGTCLGYVECGDCASGYQCTAGTCTVIPPGGGGEGGGAEGEEETGLLGVVVVPREINLRMAISTNRKEVIKITNNGATTKTLTVIQNRLRNMVILGNDSVVVQPGETKNLEVIFVAPDTPGIYTGKIWIGGIDVSVTLNVKTKLLLFDSNIIVLNKDYQVAQGSPLKTSVTLVPMGEPERLDVTLNYVIRDYMGKIYLTQSESLLVEKEIEFKRNFGTGMLPLGKYVVGLELVYPGGVAPSSAHFEVVKRTPVNFLAIIIFFLIIIILIVIILLIIYLIRRKQEEEEEKQPAAFPY